MSSYITTCWRTLLIFQLVEVLNNLTANGGVERIMEGIGCALIYGTILIFAWMDWANLHYCIFVYRALLPSYRPAPDYETAVQQKYHGAGHASGNLNIRPSHQIGILYSSQPEIHQTHIQEVSWELRFSLWRQWRIPSSGTWHCVVW
jgi:hypothetical protein